VASASDLPDSRTATWAPRWQLSRDAYYERRRQDMLGEMPSWLTPHPEAPVPPVPPQPPLPPHLARDASRHESGSSSSSSDIQALRETMRRMTQRAARDGGETGEAGVAAFLDRVWHRPSESGVGSTANRPWDGIEAPEAPEAPVPNPRSPLRRELDDGHAGAVSAQGALSRLRPVAGPYHPRRRTGAVSASRLFDIHVVVITHLTNIDVV
jgi:hypothetical protein